MSILGEKIQKVLSLHTCDPDQILEVNRSVESMIEKVTSLELVLKSKLTLLCRSWRIVKSSGRIKYQY